ncbi:alpha-glucuronidase family glycosyl hydrolase [Paenibacillus massiliensis]|uniref:alpha-glucuronidase family glycosyl hydrolase n=1 Tax=Paenibacillus massiliensis TaxID=225917 RepID=UPI00037E550B|nr:alpha-glucuronidase family glycosyl hydrolase [Paenibacillus massiliensis]
MMTNPVSEPLEHMKAHGYDAWLSYESSLPIAVAAQYRPWCGAIHVSEPHATIEAAATELHRGIISMLDVHTEMSSATTDQPHIALGTFSGMFGEDSSYPAELFTSTDRESTGVEGFIIRTCPAERCIAIGAAEPVGVLYGVYHLLRLMGTGRPLDTLDEVVVPVNGLRMLDHWDNMDGSIERGYAGPSFLYEQHQFTANQERLRDYARLMSSIGINAICINNVNVHQQETQLITPRYLPDVAKLAEVFRIYGIQLYLSINFASPLELGGPETADPLNDAVRQWWTEKAAEIYSFIPDFGGVVVKADSENRPGPFTYGRNHADGANMLAEALQPYGGIVIWRCFVYNCKQDWRDRSTDRARAAYDHFKPLDGHFHDNVVLQIKNGPLDFQVREPVSPLLGGMEHTHQILEFQITQEYTGQQRHVCYLVPQWKEILEFDTCAQDKYAPLKHVVDGSLWERARNGIAAVTNVGADWNWTGHLLAQANLYGYGRLAWNPDLSAEAIAEEWVKLVFGLDELVVSAITQMLMDSWPIYESYTSPLGVGWMVNPDHHYGPNVDGYEYSKWGTYHYADSKGIGVDRTVHSGSGYSSQYMGANAERYESLERCPDELLLFFHHVPYEHRLKSGTTVIQHIYDTHFAGADRAAALLSTWRELQGRMKQTYFEQVEARLEEQAEHAKEWRDQINTYFYRKSGIEDRERRMIY